jgi:4-amino-4-deoxy-L-arabinose transferase-like glycosyltransferase
LRLPGALAAAGAVVVAALIAREFGCDRRAQVFTAAAQATGLWTTLTGHWLTPYTMEPLQWMLLLWLVIRWQQVRDDRLLIALGLVIGIAAMTKFQVILLCPVLLVAMASLGLEICSAGRCSGRALGSRP